MPADLSGAIVLDELVVPSPGEFFAAIDKVGSASWSEHFRKPIPTTFTSRPQIALNLGGLIADGYIAVAARDGQQVRNIGRDIIALAKAVGVGENVIGRGSTITHFAETSQWEALNEELDATENEVKLSMAELKDDDLIDLVSLGAWIRGAEVVSSIVENEYSEDCARLLRQPDLLDHLRSAIPDMAEGLRTDPLVVQVDERLGAMRKFFAFPMDAAPSHAEVAELKAMASELNQLISTK